MAVGRERGFGLIEPVEAAASGAEPGGEEAEEGFAMAAVMKASPTPWRNPVVVRAIGGLDVIDEVEEALGAEEDAFDSGQPGEAQGGGETAILLLRAIAVVAAAALRVEAAVAGDGFEEARLARAVLADEDCDRPPEVEVETTAAEDRQGEGMAPGLGLLGNCRDPPQERRAEARARGATPHSTPRLVATPYRLPAAPRFRYPAAARRRLGPGPGDILRHG